jgi:hypothetical protein
MRPVVCGPAAQRDETPDSETFRRRNMTAVSEAPELILSMDESAILEIAASEGTGEFVIMRPYGKSWGAEHAVVKRLEARGLMAFKSDGRVPQTRDYLRTSSISDSGRAAAGRVAIASPPES